MRSFLWAVVYGALLWVIAFGLTWLISPLKGNAGTYALLQTIMPAVTALICLFLLALYFRKTRKNYLWEGILLGVIWLVINVVIEVAAAWILGSIKTPTIGYLTDVAFTYLMIPAIAIGTGLVLAMKK